MCCESFLPSPPQTVPEPPHLPPPGLYKAYVAPGAFLPNGQRAPGERTWAPSGQDAAQDSAPTGYVQDGAYFPGAPAAVVPSAAAPADVSIEGVPDGHGGYVYPPEGKTRIGSVFGPAASDPVAAAADAASAYQEYEYYYTENDSERGKGEYYYTENAKGGKSGGESEYYTDDDGAKGEGGEYYTGGGPSTEESGYEYEYVAESDDGKPLPSAYSYVSVEEGKPGEGVSGEGVYDYYEEDAGRPRSGGGNDTYSYYEMETADGPPPAAPPAAPLAAAAKPLHTPVVPVGGWKLSLPSVDQKLGQPAPGGNSAAAPLALTGQSSLLSRAATAAVASSGSSKAPLAAAAAASPGQYYTGEYYEVEYYEEESLPTKTGGAASKAPPAVGGSSSSALSANGDEYYYYEEEKAAPPASPIDSSRPNTSLPPSAPPSAAPPLTSTALTPEQENEYYSEYYSDADGLSAPSSIAGSLPRLNPPKATPALWNLSSAPASPRMQPHSFLAAASTSPFAEGATGTTVEARLPNEIAALEAAQFDAGEQAVLIKHLNSALQGDADLQDVLPLADGGALFDAVARSLLLPKFIHLIEPGLLDLRALSPLDAGPLSPAARRRNHALALGASRCLGVTLDGLEPSTLDDAPRHEQAVLRLIWQLTRHALLARLTPRRTPELLCLLTPDEDALTPPAPERLLLRWINLQLRECARAGTPHADICAREVANLSSDLVDAKVLGVLVYQVARRPDGAPPTIAALGEATTLGRARAVLADAWGAGVQLLELEPADLRKPRMTLAFAAALLNLRPALPPPPPPLPAAPSATALAEEREECAARLWLCSLRGGSSGGGPAPPLRHLFTEGATGLPLLHAMDALRPGHLDWKRVDRTAAAADASADASAGAAARVANCAYALEVAQAAFGLKLGSTSAADLAAGARQPMLSLVWQLQRAWMLQPLPPAMASEEALIAWANGKVAEADPGNPISQVANLRSQVLGGGLFWVRLLAAVAPEAVRAAEARGDAKPAPADAQANASYAASCAHALGVPFFSRWQDLAEARPKVAMALLAAVAAEDIRRTRAAAGPTPSPPPSAGTVSETAALARNPSRVLAGREALRKLAGFYQPKRP